MAKSLAIKIIIIIMTIIIRTLVKKKQFEKGEIKEYLFVVFSFSFIRPSWYTSPKQTRSCLQCITNGFSCRFHHRVSFCNLLGISNSAMGCNRFNYYYVSHIHYFDIQDASQNSIIILYKIICIPLLSGC